MANWESAPLANAAATGTPKWQSAPVVGAVAPVAAPVAAKPDNAYLSDLPIPGTMPEVPTAAPSNFNESAFAQGTSGVNEGIATALGAPVDLTNLALRAGAAGINAATGSDIQLPVDAIGGRKTFTDAMAPAIRPESADPGNQMIRRVGQEVGSSIVPAGGVVARSARPVEAALSQAAVTLGGGGAAAVAQQVAPNNPYVEMAAQILGGGGAAAGLGGLQRAVTPFAIPAERAAMNDVMAREGVELSAGQQTGSKGLKYAESELGGRNVSDLTDQQAEQFTQAALSRAGISAPRATPEVMAHAYDDLGNQFDLLAARNNITADQQMGQDLGAAVRDYNAVVNPTQRAPIINSTLSDLVDAIRANNGTISGDAYKSLRSRLGRSLQSSKDPELKVALRDIQGALDDAMERSMTAANSPDLGGWQQVRGDYRNYLALVDAVGGAGENAALGLISPAMLRQAVARQGKGSYVRGKGDFADLARAGVATMTPLPQSGTAPRLAVRGLANAPSAIGALLGNNAGGGVGALAGFAAGQAIPGALGKLIMSGPGRNYLTNQLWTTPVNGAQAVAGPGLGALAQLL